MTFRVQIVQSDWSMHRLLIFHMHVRITQETHMMCTLREKKVQDNLYIQHHLSFYTPFLQPFLPTLTTVERHTFHVSPLPPSFLPLLALLALPNFPPPPPPPPPLSLSLSHFNSPNFFASSCSNTGNEGLSFGSICQHPFIIS